MLLPDGSESAYERVHGAPDKAAFTALAKAFVNKRVTSMSVMELDAYGDGEIIDQAVRFEFDDGTSIVLLPQDGDSDRRYCTLDTLPEAEWDAHLATIQKAQKEHVRFEAPPSDEDIQQTIQSILGARNG